MRKILLVVALVASSVAVAVPAPAQDPAQFTFEGAGWGHGVGFSQWGAYGQSLTELDKSGEDIAAHYFAGTSVANLADLALPNDYLASVENPLWVGLAQNVEILEFTAVGGPLDICMSDGANGCISPVPEAGETWTFERISAGVCAWYRSGVQQGDTGSCRAAIAWPEADGVQVRDLTHPELICTDLSLRQAGSCEYRHGELKLRDDPVDVGFHVSLAIGLEDYLNGIWELLDQWTDPAVNQAQAIVARSYAAYEFFAAEEGGRTEFDAGLSAERKDDCWCHTYDDTRDQHYVGWDQELAVPHWVAGVEATADRVLTHPETATPFTQAGIIQAFYFASSGGWTESNTDAFGSTISYPYLQPVEDPWAIDPELGNPDESWTQTIAADTIAGLLGWDTVTAADLIEAAPGATIQFTGTDNGSVVTTTRRGGWLRTSLGLRSTVVNSIDGRGAGPPPIFSDIGGSVHEAAILQIHSAGITLGCEDGLYCPSDPVTRAQMASFIARAMGLPAATGDHFTDDAGSVHEGAINQLYEAGITSGCDDGLFCPNDEMSRKHMAAFLARALNLPPSTADPFTDDDGSPFESDIGAISEAGITSGCDEGLFCPDDPVTRAQMASFLVRAFLTEE